MRNEKLVCVFVPARVTQHGQAGMPVLLYDHHHLALASTIKLAKKNSLPATEQKFALAERNGHRRPYQTGFDVSVGIFFAMPEAHPVLWNQSAQEMQHVARDIRIGILV